MSEKIELIENQNLLRLQKYLNYELSTGMLYLLSFMAGSLVILLILAALIFMPFMLNVLIKEKRKGWLIFFVVIFVIPTIVLFVVAFTVEFFNSLPLISLGLFYLYCFLLRFSVNDWVSDIKARNEYLIQKKRRNDELNAFMKRIED